MFSNRRLVVQSALFYLPKLVSGIGGYIAFRLLFRIQGAATYGDYILMITYWNIPAILAGDIVGTSGQRLLAEATAIGGPGIKKAFQSVWRTHALALLFFGALGLLALPLANRFLFKSDFLADHLLLGVTIFFGSASLTFFRFVLRGLHLYWQTLTMDLSESILRNILWIVTCLGIARGLSLTAGAAIALVAAATVIYLLLFRKGLRPSLGKIDSEHQTEMASQARAMSMIFICNYLLTAVPAIVLNRFFGDEVVGLYAGLSRIVDISTGPMLSLAYILVPLGASAKLEGENAVRSLLTRSFKVYIFSLPFIACMAICRKEIVNLFGLENYPEAPGILLAFCVWVMFGNISALFGTLADFLGYAHSRARIMFTLSILYCAAAVFGAMQGSVVLVAWSTTIVYALMSCFYLGLISYHHSTQFMRQNASLLLRVSLCFGIAAMLAQWSWPAGDLHGFRENIQSLLVRALEFGTITLVLGAILVLRKDNGRFTIR